MVEHLHGKEGVRSSILLLGSTQNSLAFIAWRSHRYIKIAFCVSRARARAPLRDHLQDMFYVYVIEHPARKSWYIGYSADLRRRLAEHHAAAREGWKLIYYEAYVHKMDAIGREKFLKGGSGRKYLNKQLSSYLKICRGTEAVKRD